MLKMIWAASSNGWIGKDGKIPWYLPEELKHFKTLTYNHLVVMGLHTWKSLPTKPLPGRGNIVLSRNTDFIFNATVLHDILDVVELAKQEDVWVIGGTQVYEACMPYADELHVSVIPITVDGDAAEPTISEDFILRDVVYREDFIYEYYEREC